ncbi:efflux RND transporter periplasmic adaptor subunit [Rhodoferax aquaticus]|uniref:Efflux RND transporter periplasmic adaptor subunit n=1 Tax=Rhodoferax aquaticus TaxID=2527691 RepID=A0A515EQX3_9BURK|nr:efflux RND transporter periplasmic adaptor subunit [Rhodoferax aquaticus]QDL55015.1 efflux RND transporter periplasmic adaptor subunit [Rhodoferax aquaticus]
MKKIYWSVGVVGVGLLAAGAWWWTQGSAASDAQYRFGKLEVGKLQATVAASGAVNPVSQVSVGTQVSGQIRDLLVDFNSEVKAGQLLAQIDPETFEYRVRSSQADVDAAQAAVMTAQANVTAAQAQVSRAQVDLDEARRDFERKQMLVEKQFIAQSEADKARALVNTSMESLKAVQAQVGVAQAQVKTAQANVAQRQASLAQARIDLARTKITSPVNGMVIKRAIERGQTVASSLQAPELFVIAQNLSDMQVEAAIDESDVGRLRTGQKASFTVDAYPGQTFDGEIRQVRKAAQNVANVVTYVAVVGFSNVGGKLLPGMTANVRIVTDQRNEVLKVPNAALRMRIAGVEPEKEVKPDAKADGKPETKPEAPSDAKAGGGAARGMTEFRNRLVAELKLTAEQTTKVDAIYADLAPKFAALREVPAEERPKARERVSADLRARIADVLSAEQKTQYSALVAEAANRGSSASTRGRVYTVDAQGKVKALNVRLGISDGSMTEVLPDRNAQTQALKEGDEVIIGNSQGAGGAANKPRAAGPRPPF